jgi:hypothetical protein
MSQERPWWKTETFGIWVTGAVLIAIALVQFLWPPDAAHPMGPRFLSFLARLAPWFRLAITVLTPVFTAILGYLFASQRLARNSASYESELTIISADYRATNREGGAYDVTDCLQQMIRGDGLVLDIENHNFQIGTRNFVPKDPRPGVPKRLRVTYSYKGGPQTTLERPEGTRLSLPEDSFLIAQRKQLVATQQDEIRKLEAAGKAEVWRAQESNRQCQAEKREAVAKLETFTPLQLDAVLLAQQLHVLLARLGPEPAPKYTRKELDEMSSSEHKRLVDSEDGDFAEAYEYHYGDQHSFNVTPRQHERTIRSRMNRLWPWYDKLSAGYALECKDAVERIRNRFAFEGLADSTLQLPVEGRDGVKNVRAIAAKLWEFAGKLEEKKASN